VLQFQRHSFADFRHEMTHTIGRWRFLAQHLAPLIRLGLCCSLRTSYGGARR